jgi:hypothetical protein
MERVFNVAKSTGAPPALLEALQAGNVDIATAKWLLGIAGSFKGEGMNINQDGGDKGILSPEQAKKEISDIMNNKDHDYWHPARTGHQAAKDYLRKLYQMATPGSDQSGGAATVGVGGVNFHG